MKRRILTTTAAVAVLATLVCCLTVTPAWASEDKEEAKAVKMQQLPKAVQMTIRTLARGNPLTELEEKVIEDTKVYEAEWIADGQKVEIMVGVNGKVLERKSEPVEAEEATEAKAQGKGKHAAKSKEEAEEREEHPAKGERERKGGEEAEEREEHGQKGRDEAKEDREEREEHAAKGEHERKGHEEAAEREEHGQKEKKEDQGLCIDQLPLPLRQAILKQCGRHELKELKLKVVVEAEWVVDGKEIEVLVDLKGKVVAKKVEDLKAEKSEGRKHAKDAADDDNDDDAKADRKHEHKDGQKAHAGKHGGRGDKDDDEDDDKD